MTCSEGCAFSNLYLYLHFEDQLYSFELLIAHKKILTFNYNYVEYLISCLYFKNSNSYKIFFSPNYIGCLLPEEASYRDTQIIHYFPFYMHSEISHCEHPSYTTHSPPKATQERILGLLQVFGIFFGC